MTNARLKAVFDDMQRSVADVILKRKVTEREFEAFLDWVTAAVKADELRLAAVMVLGVQVYEANYGQEYANPEKDGASPWVAEGPAYVPGAPLIGNPGVLPMRSDEAGEILVVSGEVRSTSGEPLAGALLDLWQTDASGDYSSVTEEMMGAIGVSEREQPDFNLRGRLKTDDQGRYEYRTVVPGLEKLGREGGMIDELMEALGRYNERPKHIHSWVTHDGFYPLTHQIHFDGDPRVHATSEGAVNALTVLQSKPHTDPSDYRERGLDRPYRTLTCDYVLRPMTSAINSKGSGTLLLG